MDIPEFFIYHAILKGALPVKFEESSTNIIEKENIPALKEESYAGNYNNYKSGIIYELASIHYESGGVKNYSTDWEAVARSVFHSINFGKQLRKKNYFKEDLSQLHLEQFSETEQINKVLAFIKQKIKWNNKYRIYAKKGVAKAYKEGLGNSAEINLSLIAMLRAAGLDANPVLVSTFEHGIPLFPSERGFNYVIAHVATSKGEVLLDATEKYSLANILPARDLNFQGRLIQENGDSRWVELFPKKHSTEKISLTAQFDGTKIKGMMRKELDNYFGYNYRKKYAKLSKESYLSKLEENNPKLKIINNRISFLNDLNKNPIELVQFETSDYIEKIGSKIFISPFLNLSISENPFKSEERNFPVFFNKPWMKIKNIILKIPSEALLNA